MAASSRSEKRSSARRRQRIPCEIHHEDRQHTGIVLDVSPSGLFIQMTAILPPGSRVRVALKETPASPALEVLAVVARGRRVPQPLAHLAGGGIGLRVVEPSPEFRALARNPAPAPAAAPAAQTSAGSAGGVAFRVRLARPEGNRSRAVDVVARDDSAARELALAQAGSGWEVQAVSRR